MWLIQHKIIITKPASHSTMSHLLLPLSHHNQSIHLARIQSAIKYQFRGYLNFKTHFPPHLARIPNTGHLPSGGTCHNCSFFGTTLSLSLSLPPATTGLIGFLLLASPSAGTLLEQCLEALPDVGRLRSGIGERFIFIAWKPEKLHKSKCIRCRLWRSKRSLEGPLKGLRRRPYTSWVKN